jgi:hypothetical protein
VNRTPVVGNIRAARDKKDIDFHACGLSGVKKQKGGVRKQDYRGSVLLLTHQGGDAKGVEGLM